MPIAKENTSHKRSWSKAIANNFSCFFTSKVVQIAKDKCTHCAMGLDYSFRSVSTAPSHRIIALWVHPLRVSNVTDFPRTTCHQLQRQVGDHICGILKSLQH